jgi:exodeoxyribonuclease V alpha subunit
MWQPEGTNAFMYFLGHLVRKVFRPCPDKSPEFGIATLHTIDEGMEPDTDIPLKGLILKEFTPQDLLRVFGEWEDHDRYGRQFKATSILREPRNAQGYRNFLIHRVSGVGPKRADLLLKTFGDELRTVFEKDPERLVKIKGVGAELAGRMVADWAEYSAEVALSSLLDELGLSTSWVWAITQALGPRAEEIIRKNPYELLAVHGIGFKKADAAAQCLGFDKAAPDRAKAVLHYLLEDAACEGHAYLPRGEVILRAAEECEVDQAQMNEVLDEVLADEEPKGGPLLVQEFYNSSLGKIPVIYLRRMFRAETRLAINLRRLIEGKPYRQFSPAYINLAIGKAEQDLKLTLNEMQKQAVRAAFMTSLSVLTGDPGTGKTTTLRVLVWVAEHLNLRFLLAAPTGRAAKRITEVTGAPAGTLHRMLEYDVIKHRFTKDRDDPLDSDMVILDEVSMLDLLLSESTMEAIPTGCSVVLVGDPNQLPSVGAGRVLDDIIQSGRAPVTCLTEIFRQAQKSLIVNNANKILRGQSPQFYTDQEGRAGALAYDCYLVKAKMTEAFRAGKKRQVVNPDWCKNVVVKLVSGSIPTKLGLDPIRDVQVLVPQKMGECGVFAMNRHLQQALNPQPENRTVTVRGQEYRYGDRVLVTSNNYKLEVFNGDIGFIEKFDVEDKVFVIDFDGRSVVYPFKEAGHLLLAYAMTVHKAQGSEYKAVVAVILKEHYMMLKRNLLYTATTRAKQLLIFVAQTEALEIAVSRNDVERRNSLLAFRLKAGVVAPIKEVAA